MAALCEMALNVTVAFEQFSFPAAATAAPAAGAGKNSGEPVNV